MDTRKSNTGERSAVRPNSGASVYQSDPGLRRPTPPATAGRKPEARPPVLLNPGFESAVALESRAAGLSQPKTGRGVGQSPAKDSQRIALSSSSECLKCDTPANDPLDDFSIASVIQFFKILDRWDREAHAN